MNHQDPGMRAAVSEGSVTALPACNIAGCCQAFRSELLDEVGLLMQEFSPYGFEDVEFCIRVTNAGRQNYVDPQILMLHGTDQRHVDRRSPQGVVATQRNFMRCKTLLAWRHAHTAWRASMEASIIRRYALARQSGNHRTAAHQLHAHVSGCLDAQRQIEHAERAHEAGTPR